MRQETHHSDGLLDARAAELAFRQHGVVAMAQLRALGFGRGAIERRIRNGRLHRFHRGVYAVGHRRLTERGRVWAALLACGGPGRAVVSHASAGALWDLVAPPSVIHVTTLAQSRSVPGIRVHRATSVESTELDGLPVTTVAQTLLDLATRITEHRLKRACHRAEHLRLLDMRAVDTLLAEQPGRRGTARLRRALRDLAEREPEITRSDLEERFLALADETGLPRPEVNVVLEGLEVDFLWRDQRLAVETDGRATHLTPAAFEHDRERDQRLTLAGWRVVRFTRRQVLRERARVAAALRELLSGPR